jgi:hypothetical protein
MIGMGGLQSINCKLLSNIISSKIIVKLMSDNTLIPLVGNAAHVNVAFYEPKCTGTFVRRSGLL